MAGQRRGGIERSGQYKERYDDVLDLDGCYLVYVYVRDHGRACKLDDRKEANRRRKERMDTVNLLYLSRNKALVTGVGGGFLTVALG